MRKRLFVALGILVLLLAGAVYGSWSIYQHHLSADLRRTLTAAVDPTASDADVHAYLRDARLQVRTTRDKELLGKLTRIVQLSEDATEQGQLIDQSFHETLQSFSGGPCEQLETLSSDELRSSLGTDLRKQCGEQAKSDKLSEQMTNSEERREDQDKKEAKQLYDQLRSDLGLAQVKQ